MFKAVPTLTPKATDKDQLISLSRLYLIYSKHFLSDITQ